ncbi:MAG: type II secretion system F family protein [bacterium]|nr:type II secretion system F family protein [bacterium]
MRKFAFKAKTETGQLVRGVIEAVNFDNAKRLLLERGYHILGLKEKKSKLGILSRIGIRRGVNQNDLVNFTRQLSTMLDAGLPLTDALEILESQSPGALGRVLRQVLSDVQGGSSFGKALSHNPQVFDPVYVSLIRSGEAAGSLDKVLSRLADNLEKKREFSSKVRGALIYPAIVIAAMMMVAGVMIVVVIPKLSVLYESFNAQLPLATRILIGLSDFLIKFWWLLGIGVIGGINLISWIRKTPTGGYLWDRMMLRLPVWGRLQNDVVLTNVSYTLSMLLEAGVSLLTALEISAQTAGNQVYKNSVKAVADQVEKGVPMSMAMEMDEVFPAILPQMINIGEETGKIDEVLAKLSRFFEVEAEQKVKNLTTAIEPLIMIVLGVGVGFLVISIIMPIYNLTSQF